MHRGATEARTGHGWDAVTEMLPVFMGRPHRNRVLRHPAQAWAIKPISPNAQVRYNLARHKMTTATGHRYIVNDHQILGGEPIILGTRTPVRAIVETWRLGVPAEEIPSALPHLTLAQVFDALSYYSDHQEEINAHIERNRILLHQIDPRVSSL
jgi:uncharacterized protein (DUF433 family)